MVVTLSTTAAAPAASGTRTSVTDCADSVRNSRVSSTRCGRASGWKRPALVAPLSSYVPSMSTTRWPPVWLNTSTRPSVPTGTVTRLGIARPSPSSDQRSSTFRFDAVGMGDPCGKAVQNPTPAVPTTVMLSTAARVVSMAGSGDAPATRTDTVPPAGTGVPASRVSRSRVGDGSATKRVVSPGAA